MSDERTIADVRMEAAGFSIPKHKDVYRVFCSTQGGEKCGKTDWALRHTPGPIAVLSLDTGTREIAEKMTRDTGKQIMVWEGEVPPSRQQKQVYEEAWNRFFDAHSAVMENPDIRTEVWDTATEVWELKRLASFGKLTQVMPHHYGPVNAEFRDLIKGMYRKRPDMNVVLIHKLKKQYKKGSDGKDSWSGKYERAGFDDIRYLVDVQIQHYFSDGEFGIRVLSDGGVGARQTMDLADTELEGDECSFFWLAQYLYPEVEPEYWWDGSSGHPLAE